MSQRTHLTQSDAWRVVGRLEGGQSSTAIGVVQNVMFQTGFGIHATTPNENRYLTITARRPQNMSVTLLRQHLRSATGTTISAQTARNRLHAVGLYVHRPTMCFRLPAGHRRALREWVTERVHWKRIECRNIHFSDESRFSLHSDNRRIFI